VVGQEALQLAPALRGVRGVGVRVALATLAEALQEAVLVRGEIVLVEQHPQLGRLPPALVVGELVVVLGDQGKALAIRAPALAALLLNLLEEEHVRPIAAHMAFGILFQLRVDLLEVLVPIAALLGRSLPGAEAVEHLGHHLPHAGMVLPVRLERALDALRLDDVKQGHRFRHIEVRLRGARRPLVVVAARHRRGILRLLWVSRIQVIIMT